MTRPNSKTESQELRDAWDENARLQKALTIVHHTLGKFIAYRNDKDWLAEAIKVHGRYKDISKS